MNDETLQGYPPAAAARLRSGRRRQVLSVAVNVVVGVLLYGAGVIAGALSIAGVPGAVGGAGELTGVGMLAFFCAALLWLAVFVRTKWPLAVLVAGTLIAVAGGDAVLLLIGIFHSVIRAPQRIAVVSASIGSAVLAWSVIWACVRDSTLNPFAVFFLEPDQELFSVNGAVEVWAAGVNALTIIFGILGLAVAWGFGWMLRRTRRMRAVEAVAARQTQRSDSLTEELARTSERVMLARELHDTLSHRLSVISLHSGALEVGNSDPETAETAAALRREAKASLEDLRGLVSGVRSGSVGTATAEHQTAPAQASLRTLPDLIDSVRAAGTDVRPILVLQDADSAPTLLNRAVYRIVQEALTNAMKHAPGAPIAVDVRVSAEDGVRIVVSNPLPESDADGSPVTGEGPDLAGSGGGMGLPGMHERARMLGGTAVVGPRNGAFVVDVSLPGFPSPETMS